MIDYGIYKDNPSARSIIRNSIEISNKWWNKYNEAMHRKTEELTGEVNDRVSSDTGNDPIPLNELYD